MKLHTPEGVLTAWTVKETLFLWSDGDKFKLWFWRNRTWWFVEWSDGVPKMKDEGNLVDDIAMAMEMVQTLLHCGSYLLFFFFIFSFIFVWFKLEEDGVDMLDTCNDNNGR